MIFFDNLDTSVNSSCTCDDQCYINVCDLDCVNCDNN